ncbi:hypothetical protein H4I96_02586 [Botrytis cinerea]
MGSMLEAALLVEETYAIDDNACLTLVATSLVLDSLLRGGTLKQQKEYLIPFLQLEGGNGLQVTTRRGGNFMVINGRKTSASKSSGWTDQGADLQYLVTCEVKTLDATQYSNADPFKCYVAPRTSRTHRYVRSIGRVHKSASPNLTHPRYPGKSTAAAVVESFMDSGALVSAAAVGNMRTVYEEALKFAKTDTRGGAQPIIHHQSVSNLLANIKMRTDASRLLVWKACDDLDKEKGWELAVEDRVFPTEMAYSKDTEFPRLLNDAVVLPLFDGGNYGIRRRQLEHIVVAADYDPWATLYQ